MGYIDAHNHLDVQFGGGWIERPAGELVDVLDASGIDVLVDLSGGWGRATLRRHLDHFKAFAPSRFVMLGGIPWARWQAQGPRFPELAARSLRFQFADGACGLKIWKDLGLTVQDERGQLVAVDDRRLDPIWQVCAERSFPVVIHTGDPVHFFEPIGPDNPRSRDLLEAPEWHWHLRSPIGFDALVDQFASLLDRRPDVTFVAAHLLDLIHAPAILDLLIRQNRNLMLDTGARFQELGQATPELRSVLARHQDRLLFGLDHPPAIATYAEAVRTVVDVIGSATSEVGAAAGADSMLYQVLRANAARVFGL